MPPQPPSIHFFEVTIKCALFEGIRVVATELDEPILSCAVFGAGIISRQILWQIFMIPIPVDQAQPPEAIFDAPVNPSIEDGSASCGIAGAQGDFGN